MKEWLVILSFVFGASLMFLAGLGILRMPDVFTRMHASTKGASLGVALMLAAAALYFWDLQVTTKAIVTTAFIFITAPVGAHMLARASYSQKVPLWKASVIDEALGKLAGESESNRPPGRS